MRITVVHLLLLLCPAGVALGSSVEGFTEPFRKIDIAPPEPGTIARLAVKEGDRISKGEVLAALDCEHLVIAREMAKASMESHGRLDSAVAERDLRINRLAKLEELRTRGHASEEEVARAKTDAAIAEANLLAAQEQLRLDALEYQKSEAMIERRTMRSPIDGVVTRVFKEEREFVSVSSPTVLTVAQLNVLRITFSVPSVQAAELSSGQRVRLTFSETGETAFGKVELIAPVTDAESGTVRVKVLLENPQREYRCGVRCCLEFEDEEPASKKQASTR